MQGVPRKRIDVTSAAFADENRCRLDSVFLEFYLRPKLDNSVRRNIEKLRCRPRVPRHEDEKFFSPHRQRSIPLGEQTLTTEVIRRLRRNSDNSFLLTPL